MMSVTTFLFVVISIILFAYLLHGIHVAIMLLNFSVTFWHLLIIRIDNKKIYEKNQDFQ